jgi:hypothetical protein
MDGRFFVSALFAAVVTAALVSCNKTSPTGPTPVCTYTISPGGSAISSDGGSGTVTVTAPAGCSWTATSAADWITITAGASGSGSGTVTYSAASNGSATTRTGAVMIAGQSHSITQQGRTPSACSYELLPANADFSKDGGSGTFTITAPADCAWTASSTASWLVITGGGRGSGPGTISFTVARHTDVAERTAAITVADRRFNVRQSGDVSLCQYSIAPVLFNPCMAGGSVTATITTQASCPWTATPNTAWLTVPTGGAGSGSANMSIAFSDNYDAPREGILMVRWPTPTAGQNIRVAQAGCRYAVSKTTVSIAASGGTETFEVIQQSDPTECGGATQNRCIWTARSEVAWITITSRMPQSGDNPVSFTVSATDSTSPRTGTIVVRDKVVTVTQAGK